MPDSPLLQRLKERKLVQWTIAYLAGAFVVFQLLDALETPLGLTPTIQQAILAIVVVGFFITLVLAWYHGEKGRQRVSGPELLIISLLFLVSGGVLSILGSGADAGSNGNAILDLDRTGEKPSIAVLPLDNLSPDPDDAYFANGVHEDITTALSRISSLTVRGRSSVDQYRENRPNIREMASALGVDFLLEGSARIVGTVVKVTVQLIDARLDEHVWADEYETEYVPEEAIRIQGQIAQQVSAHLSVEISPREEALIASLPTENREALRLYHQGRHLWNQRKESEVRQAIRLFQEAIDLDPNFAGSYAGLADAFLILGNFAWERPMDSYPLALAAAERALELEPSVPGPHVTLGGVDFWYTRDWPRAEEHFLQAIALDPGHAYARYWYSIFLNGMGRPDEAFAEVTMARDLDPLAPQIGRGFADHFFNIRDFERSVAEHLRNLDLHPDFANGFGGLCISYAGAGRFQEAVTACERAESLLGMPEGGAPLALIRALQGNREGARQEVERVRTLRGDDRVHPVNLAEVFIALGDFEEALRLLTQARAENRPYLSTLTYKIFFDPIRSDPRFLALLDELNLPVLEFR